MRLPISILGVFLFLTYVVAAQADQESAKGRLDDCFGELSEIGSRMNVSQGTSEGPRLNQKFRGRQAKCLSLKKEYESKYGKYAVPGSGRKSKRVDLNKTAPDDLIAGYCDAYKRVVSDEEQIKLQSDDEANAASVKDYKKSVLETRAQMKQIQSAFKKQTKTALEDSECDPNIFSEQKYIRYLQGFSICSTKCVTADKDPAQLEEKFCETTDEDRRSVLSKLHKKLIGTDAFCKRSGHGI